MNSKNSFKETDIGLIPKDWDFTKLNSACNIKMGQSPPSKFYNTERNGLPFFQGRKDFDEKYPQVTMWCSKPIRIAGKGEVLLSVRAPIGDINMSTEQCCIGRGLSSISMKNKNNEFLFYLLQYNKKRLKDIFESEGTVFGCITKKGLQDFKVAIPNEYDQIKIAKILSDLDQKIELNNQMNQTLESIGQAIFRHWFAHYEFPDENGQPYKSSGGEMVDSELGEIPKGWKIGKFSDIANLMMGLSPKSDTYNQNGVGMPLLNGAADLKENTIAPSKFTTNPTRICNKGDLLFCIRATIGNINFADKEYCLGRGVAAINGKEDYYREFIYFNLLRSLDLLLSQAVGTVIKGLSKPDIENLEIIIPNNRVIKKYNFLINSFFTQIDNNKKENQNLSQIRDSLLPKLMSGKIRVPKEAAGK